MHCPPGSWTKRYHREKFAAFLERNGVTEGTPPKLPTYCVEEPEEGFKRLVRMGIDKYTYFARGKWTGRIKIGQSNDPWRRVHELINASFGEEAELLVTLRGGHFESVYHEAFRPWLEGHEWFAPHPDILAEIDRLNERDVALMHIDPGDFTPEALKAFAHPAPTGAA